MIILRVITKVNHFWSHLRKNVQRRRKKEKLTKRKRVFFAGAYPQDNVIEQNHIHTIGMTGKQVAGYFQSVAGHNTVRRNVICTSFILTRVRGRTHSSGHIRVCAASLADLLCAWRPNDFSTEGNMLHELPPPTVTMRLPLIGQNRPRIGLNSL